MAMGENGVLGGIHHVTAVTGQARANVRFYTQVLGLRLVKRTVKQDDTSAYHLFYGDRLGSPGTELTFFDWPHLPPHQPGHGEVALIALRVPTADVVAWWEARLEQFRIHALERGSFLGRAALFFRDPEGQRLALVDDGGSPGGEPWDRAPVPRSHAIKGIFGVLVVVRSREPSLRVLCDVLQFREIGRENVSTGTRIHLACEQGSPGTFVVLDERPDLPRANLGVGGVHHIAFRVPDDATHRMWRERIAAARIPVTPPIDRYYFRSLYFREPGGVLYEIATDGPGFTIDEDPEYLGEALSLLPFLESRREEIERRLSPLDLGVE